MRKTLRQKVFVFLVILHVLGVAFTSIPGQKACTISDDSALVEVTTHIHDVNKDSLSRIRVTPQESEEIQRIFDDLKNHLSTADSLEETHRIFNDTIDALARHGLLPEDISMNHLKRLATNARHYQKMLRFRPTRFTTFQGISNEGEMQNFFCFVAGNTSNTHTAKLAKRMALRLNVIIDHGSGNVILVNAATALWIVFNEISKITQTIVRLNGPHCGVSMYFGNYHYYPYPDWLHPSEGWIATNGINGKQNISGSFWGQTMTGGWQPQADWYMNYTWRGCLGFTGLIIYTGVDNAYFLGSALHVHVGPNRP
jgi:hypothetical protein